MASTWRACQRRGGRQQLQEIQRRPLGRQQRARVRLDLADRVVRRPCARLRRHAASRCVPAGRARARSRRTSRGRTAPPPRARSRGRARAARRAPAWPSSRRGRCLRPARRARCARAPARASRWLSNMLRPRRCSSRSRGCATAAGMRRDEVEHACRCSPAPARAPARRHGSRRVPCSRHCTTPCSAFIAIHGQCAQLLQVALVPAVGASSSVLPGASWRMRCMMPLSVATMKVCASPLSAPR